MLISWFFFYNGTHTHIVYLLTNYILLTADLKFTGIYKKKGFRTILVLGFQFNHWKMVFACKCNQLKVFFLMKNLEKQLNSALILIIICFYYRKQNHWQRINGVKNLVARYQIER